MVDEVMSKLNLKAEPGLTTAYSLAPGSQQWQVRTGDGKSVEVQEEKLLQARTCTHERAGGSNWRWLCIS